MFTTDNRTKAKAKEFIKKFSLSSDTLTAERMKSILMQQGFKLYKHNKHGNSSECVQEILKALNIAEYAKGKDAFVYISSTDRLVFYHRQLSEEELLYVLLHEEGHIFLEHNVRSNLLAYNDVISEKDANAFALYVSEYAGRKNKNAMVAAGAATALLTGILLYKRNV